MRINEELEKILLKLEENNNENIVRLLDVTQALEKTYFQINNCFLKDEKDFNVLLDNFDLICKKEKYDADNYKTIYNVSKKEEEDILFNIEVSNSGEFDFRIKGQNKEKIQELIDLVNHPLCQLMELVKVNADVSFFTENRELVISQSPYLALKMDNFVDGNKAVLVYELEEGQKLNKTIGGEKHIRVDQITEYLKNIKIDERIVPTLAYAFYKGNNMYQFEIQKDNIEATTYPYLTQKDVEKLTEKNYLKNAGDAAASIGLVGSAVLALSGAIIGSTTFLPVIPCMLVGVGLPTIVVTSLYQKDRVNVKRAHKKEGLVKDACKELYKVLKEYSNENINQIEEEIMKKRNKKLNEKRQIEKVKDLSPKELINELKREIKNENNIKANLYLPVLQQLENAYGLNNGLVIDDELATNKEIYNELLELSKDVVQLSEMNPPDALENTLASMKRILYLGDTTSTICNLNDLIDFSSKLSTYYPHIDKEKLNDKITKMYLEVMLYAKAKDEDLSIQVVASIPFDNRQEIVQYVTNFVNRLRELDLDKQVSASYFNHMDNMRLESKIVKMIDIIHKENLSYDLLGKNIREKVKVKNKVEK